jgi:hypothetical protein
MALCSVPPSPKSAESFSISVPLHKVDGRLIRYHIGDDNGDIDEDEDPRSFTFNGTSLEDLLERLHEETGLEDMVMCSRSPINGKLLPLRLQLPPDNIAMNIVLVSKSSKGALPSSSLVVYIIALTLWSLFFIVQNGRTLSFIFPCFMDTASSCLYDLGS